MMLSRTKFLTASEVTFLNEIASDHLVKHSVAASIGIFPLDGGEIGPIKSMDQVWKGQGMSHFPFPLKEHVLNVPIFGMLHNS